jgi:RNA polymerase sigma factor (sigma-70 family)
MRLNSRTSTHGRSSTDARLKTLNDKERLLVDCIYFNGFTEQETAEILNVTQKTVNVRKHKIIKKLRNSLSDWL